MTQPTEAAGLPEMEITADDRKYADYAIDGSKTLLGVIAHRMICEVKCRERQLLEALAQIKTLTAERDEARAAINIPETEDFFKGRIIPLGTAHRMIRELTASLDEARKQSSELREAALDFLVETDERNLTSLASEAFRKLKRIVVAPTPTGGKRNE